jgi:hypothetical protein
LCACEYKQYKNWPASFFIFWLSLLVVTGGHKTKQQPPPPTTNQANPPSKQLTHQPNSRSRPWCAFSGQRVTSWYLWQATFSLKQNTGVPMMT